MTLLTLQPWLPLQGGELEALSLTIHLSSGQTIAVRPAKYEDSLLGLELLDDPGPEGRLVREARWSGLHWSTDGSLLDFLAM